MPRDAPVTRAVLPVRVGMIVVLVVAAADNVTAFDPHTWSGPGILMVFGFRSARSDIACSFNLASAVPVKSNVMDVMRPGTAKCAAQTARDIETATRDWSRGR